MGQIIARQHHVRDAAHHAVEQIDRQTDRAHYGGAIRRCRIALRGRGGYYFSRIQLGATLKRGNQGQLAASGQGFVSLNPVDDLANAIDRCQNGRDEPGIGCASVGTHFCQGFFGGMAEALETGKIEEAAIALYGVHKAEDGIQTRAIGWIGFPSDNLALDSFHHFARFRDKISE